MKTHLKLCSSVLMDKILNLSLIIYTTSCPGIFFFFYIMASIHVTELQGHSK